MAYYERMLNKDNVGGVVGLAAIAAVLYGILYTSDFYGLYNPTAVTEQPQTTNQAIHNASLMSGIIIN